MKKEVKKLEEEIILTKRQGANSRSGIIASYLVNKGTKVAFKLSIIYIFFLSLFLFLNVFMDIIPGGQFGKILDMLFTPFVFFIFRLCGQEFRMCTDGCYGWVFSCTIFLITCTIIGEIIYLLFILFLWRCRESNSSAQEFHK